MKKTLTINLSGIVFHIDEDAYEKLNVYLDKIKTSFSVTDGQEEIMSDIEARIAEMLQEKAGQNKQVVTVLDIEYVMNVMGKPEEFISDNTSENKEEKKSDAENNSNYSKRQKRIFRHPDERIFGGVCSGIAAYFGFDPIWLRIAFAVSVFFFGTGFLLYIILWIIIPLAKTTSEKLEMRGEPVNVDNISKTINEEAAYLKKKMNHLKDEVNANGTKERVKNIATDVGNFFLQLLEKVIKLFGKVAGIILIFIGTLLLFALLATLFGVGSIHIVENGQQLSYSINEIGTILFNSSQQVQLAIIGFCLLLGIPFIRMIYAGFRILFQIPRTNRMLRISFNVLWTLGFLLFIYTVIVLVRDFKVKVKTNHNIALQQPKSNILYLRISPSENWNDEEEYEESIQYNDKRLTIKSNNKWGFISFDEKNMVLGPAQLNIVPNESDSFELIITGIARGETKKDALNRAKKIKYHFNQTDSVLELDAIYELATEDKWRGQEIQLTLKVPRNKIVFIDKSMKHIIYDIKNASNTLDQDMLGRKWIMDYHELKCIDCTGISVEEDEKGIAPNDREGKTN